MASASAESTGDERPKRGRIHRRVHPEELDRPEMPSYEKTCREITRDLGVRSIESCAY